MTGTANASCTVAREGPLVGSPHADVVAGLPAAGEVEVDLHAEFFLRHGELPEQAVAGSLPGHRPVPQVVGGAEAGAARPGGAHGSAPSCVASALRVVGTCTSSAWPRFSSSSADRKE